MAAVSKFPTLVGWIVWGVCYVLMLLVCGLGCPIRVHGRSRFPSRGPVLILCNHQGYMDPPLVGLIVGRPIRYLARQSLFRGGFFRWLIETLGAIPIDREGSGRAGLQHSLELLKAGQSILIFPEGTRSETGEVGPLQPGVLLLLRRAKVPVVLVGLAGSYECWSRHQKRPMLRPITMELERFEYAPEELGDTAAALDRLRHRLIALTARAYHRQRGGH